MTQDVEHDGLTGEDRRKYSKASTGHTRNFGEIKSSVDWDGI